MAVGQSGNSSASMKNPCDCYTVPDLTSPILKSSLTSNLRERYSLGGQLGWGQFGVIRECTDMFTREKLACKSIAKDRLVTEDDLLSVKLEIEIMSRLSGHPNVVELKAVYEEEHHVHLVMELCAGGELFHLLESCGRFPEPQARTLFRQLMEVVMFCHDKGIVHRDLKPENILLVTSSPSSPIKLADFGLATFIEPGKRLYGTVGSPFYIAPEVLGGGYDQAADVWSAGVVLYILLSGMPPFWAKTKSGIFDAVRAAKLCFPSHHWADVSPSAMDLISGMLRKDPAQRLTSARVLDHPWMRDCRPESQGTSGSGEGFGYGEAAVGAISFSSQLDMSPPAFSCRSSFSSFLVGHISSTSNTGFSFRSCGEVSHGEFSSPIQSLPSFNFFSPGPSCSGRVQRESSFGQLFTSEVEEVKEERQSRRGAAVASKSLAMRNRTIGAGEFQPVELAVTESIIRWASCTRLPSAPSLTSSLVC